MFSLRSNRPTGQATSIPQRGVERNPYRFDFIQHSAILTEQWKLLYHYCRIYK